MEEIRDETPPTRIYLSVNHLEKGKYELRIISKDRVLKELAFTKK